MNQEEQSIFNKGYKYPYLACEILSHDYPFLVDRIINMDFFGQENNTIGGELSMIKNNSNVDEGDEGGPDDSMGEFRNHWKITEDLYQEMIDVAETCLALEEHKKWVEGLEDSAYKDEKMKQIKKDIRSAQDGIKITLAELKF